MLIATSIKTFMGMYVGDDFAMSKHIITRKMTFHSAGCRQSFGYRLAARAWDLYMKWKKLCLILKFAT